MLRIASSRSVQRVLVGADVEEPDSGLLHIIPCRCYHHKCSPSTKNESRTRDPEKDVVKKCTLCQHRIDQGRNPSVFHVARMMPFSSETSTIRRAISQNSSLKRMVTFSSRRLGQGLQSIIFLPSALQVESAIELTPGRGTKLG